MIGAIADGETMLDETSLHRSVIAGDPVNFEILGNLGEFISGIVVIISLVYLATQVRQNTRSLRTENYARALDRIAAMQSRLSQDAEFCELFTNALNDPYRLSPNQRIQFTWSLYEMFGAVEFLFHQGRAGAVPEEVWERWSETLGWWMLSPGVRDWWQARPAPFSASFTSYVDALMESAPANVAANERWRDFVRADARSHSRNEAEG